MAVLIPYMNPVRFRNPLNQPNYINVWPNSFNTGQRVEYVKGMNPTEYFKDHVTNRPLTFQFWQTTTYDNIITIYRYNRTLELYQFDSTVNGENITPTGWITGHVYKFTFTPTQSGIYKMDYIEGGIESDEFVVHHADVELKKQLVEVQYYNSSNNYGMVFFDGVTQKYTGISYFTGILQNYEPGNDISAYTSYNGAVEVLKAFPVHGSILTLTNIHNTYVDNINHIFSCDTLTVNGVIYSKSENMEIEPIEESDLVNIKIKLKKKIISYYET